MSDTEETKVAGRFLAALAEAAQTGNPESVYPFLADDVDWVPRALSGIEEVRERSSWPVPPEDLDFEFEIGEIANLGEGRLAVDVRQLYRMKSTGEVASTRDRRIELTILDGKISRYDMQVVG